MGKRFLRGLGFLIGFLGGDFLEGVVGYLVCGFD